MIHELKRRPTLAEKARKEALYVVLVFAGAAAFLGVCWLVAQLNIFLWSLR